MPLYVYCLFVRGRSPLKFHGNKRIGLPTICFCVRLFDITVYEPIAEADHRQCLTSCWHSSSGLCQTVYRKSITDPSASDRFFVILNEFHLTSAITLDRCTFRLIMYVLWILHYTESFVQISIPSITLVGLVYVSGQIGNIKVHGDA